jgi:hypothetical protein
VPLFLLLFAWAYYTMAANHPANFGTHPLTSQSARLVVTAQMLLDLVALGPIGHAAGTSLFVPN